MQKRMFNKKCGLEQAVIEGWKDMTRRIEKSLSQLPTETGEYETITVQWCLEYFLVRKYYKGAILEEYHVTPELSVGEVVAVAQSYKDAGYEPGRNIPLKEHGDLQVRADSLAGWTNKMFVRADLMPYKFEITDVKLQRLQDISDEDCLREGIQSVRVPDGCVYVAGGKKISDDDRKRILSGELELAKQCVFLSPTTAFAALIDKVSGKGTWERNPWVLAYEFKLCKEEF